MQSIIRKTKTSLPFILFLCVVFISMFLVRFSSGDDYVYRDAQQTYGSIGTVIESLYTTWSGRIPILWVTMKILNFPLIVWKILNSLIFCVVLIIIVCSSGTTKKDQKLYITSASLAVIALYFIHIDILDGSVFWITGAINYLWGTAAMLVILIPFFYSLKSQKVYFGINIFAVLCTVYGCYIEQSAAIVICYGAFTLIVLFVRKKLPIKTFVIEHKWLIAILLFAVLNTLILYIAPGNYVRNHSETVQWFHTYDMYDMWDKLLLGFARTMDIICKYGVWFLFPISICLIKYCAHKKDYIFLLLSTLICLYFIGMACNMLLKTESVFWLYDFQLTDVSYFSKKLYFVYGVATLVILSTSIILLKQFDLKKNSKFISIIFIGAICSGIIMGFSATIYASKLRVFLTMFILLAFVLVDIIVSMLEEKVIPQVKLPVVFAVLVLASLCISYIWIMYLHTLYPYF